MWRGALILMLAGCSTLKVDGACVYTREVKTSYECEAGGSMEHVRVLPPVVTE